MTPTRSSVFLSELKNLESTAQALQAELPVDLPDRIILERYKNVSDILEAVLPRKESDPGFSPVLGRLVRDKQSTS